LIDYGSRFYIESNGTLHASNGQFSGNISGSSVSGGSVSGANITGGSISIHKGKFYLEMGLETKNPSVSGLTVGTEGFICNSTLNSYSTTNMHGAINLSNKTIRIYTGNLFDSGSYTALSGFHTLTVGGHTMSFYNGFLVNMD